MDLYIGQELFVLNTFFTKVFKVKIEYISRVSVEAPIRYFQYSINNHIITKQLDDIGCSVWFNEEQAVKMIGKTAYPKKNYVQGRVNLAATIFVPYDCTNNCSFCTSKNEYKDCSGFSLTKIIKQIQQLNKIEMVKEFVITGGEPFADLKKLKLILSHMQKDIYINTTLPKSNLDESIGIINNCEKIKGVSISRHLDFDFKNVADISDIDKILKPVRINCVLPSQFLKWSLLNFITSYGKKRRDINLRVDYRTTTIENLKSPNADINWLCDRFNYVESTSCLVCNTDYFSVENEFLVSYHRGLEKSSVEFGNKIYINDIIIKQDGQAYYDWDMHCLIDLQNLK